MEANFFIFPLASIIPLVVCAIYYNPKVAGNLWMEVSGTSEEKAQSGNMAIIFGLAYLFSLFIALTMGGIVIHQTAIQSLLVTESGFGEAGSEVQTYFEEFLKMYGDKDRTFSHGAFHGAFAGILFAWPIIGTIALFERKGWKYTAVHTVYWVISLALMGGVVAAYV